MKMIYIKLKLLLLMNYLIIILYYGSMEILLKKRNESIY